MSAALYGWTSMASICGRGVPMADLPKANLPFKLSPAVDTQPTRWFLHCRMTTESSKQFFWGGFTTERFTNFVQATIHAWKASAPLHLRHDGPIVILDNVHSHSEAKLKELGVAYKFLPPYSPFLNPMEDLFQAHFTALKRLNRLRADEFFAIDKTAWGQKTNKRHEVLARIREDSWKTVSTMDIVRNAVVHMRGYLKRCINMEPIED
jgi:transposase